VTKYRKIAYLCLTLTAVFWGAAVPISKVALEIISPFELLFFRSLFALPFALPILFFEFKNKKIDTKKIPLITLIEITALIVLVLLYMGTQRTTSLEASLILNTRTIFIIVAGIILLKETEEKHEWLGVGISTLGMAIISLTPLILNPTGSSLTQSLFGNSLIVLCNLIAAIGLIVAKKAYQTVPKFFISAYSVLVGLVVMGAITLFETDIPTLIYHLSLPQVLLPAVYTGIFVQIIGLTLHLTGYNLIEASEAALFRYLHPLIYIPLAVVWLKESISFIQIAALALVVIGIIIAERKPHHRHHESHHLRMH
jgi:drug/metabolite transporter (DMT)-like permease